MALLPLRFYQSKAIDGLRASFRAGKKRPLLQLPTGAGKTLVAAEIGLSARGKGRRFAFVAPAIALIDQTCEKFERAGIAAADIGVIQGSHWRHHPDRPVQVCSAQTIAKGRVPEVDLVIIDEAHETHAAVIRWLNGAAQGVPVIGLTATPWAKGLGHIFDDLVVGSTTQDLIEAGFLSPFRVFAPAHPDLSGVKVTAGDFNAADLSKTMQDEKLVANIVANWLENGEDRPTLCFCVDRAHAMGVHLRFQDAGVPSAYLDGETDDIERKRIERALHDGSVKVVCNVGVLTKGIDWDVRCLILARPTRSEMLFVQIVGRGLRTADGKSDCLIFDHANNHERLGFVTDIHHAGLDTTERGEQRRTQRQRPGAIPAECSKCGFLRPLRVPACPSCGHVAVHMRFDKEQDGELVEKGAAQARVIKADKKRWLSELATIAAQKGYKPGWAAMKFKEKFGHWPDGIFADPTVRPSAEVLRWCKAQQIRWAKSKGREGAAA